jgi:hypothetical protein
VGFVVDNVALGQVSTSTSVSPANDSTNFSIIIITRGWHNRPLVAALPSRPKWSSPPTIPIKKKLYYLFKELTAGNYEKDL